MSKIAIVAGEASGDLLGSHLVATLKQQRGDLEFFGIAGPKMMREGVKSLYPIERLSVRGYVEVLSHLPGLLKMRRQLLNQILVAKPDVFVGVDAPDFNFWLERKLKKHGIPTIHYVSPSIWAWRGGRIHNIKRAVSHMLALFPFEPVLYEKAQIPVTYVGHPLADEIPLKPSKQQARETLRLRQSDFVVTLLPGSRQSEVKQHAELFVKTAKIIAEEHTHAVFLVPLITRQTRTIFENVLMRQKKWLQGIHILFGHAHEAMEAADIIIVASGTATLEAALLKRPMIITYRMPTLSWWILKHMRYQPYVGLPNILAGKFLVPELLQGEATPEKLADMVTRVLNEQATGALQQEFTQIHKSLKQDSAKKSAEVVLSYLK